MIPAYERDGIRLYVGDCREVVPALPEPVSAVVTDPPYGLSFMSKDWDHEVPGVAFWEAFKDAMLPGAHLLSFGGSRTYHRIAVAIEDAGFEIRDTLMWLYGSGFPKSLDVSKAIDKAAGAERDNHGTQRPETRVAYGKGAGALRCSICGKSRNGTSCTCDITAPATDAARDWQGWGTALKPSFEPVIMARKPLAGTVAQNVLTHGTGALNIDACRIGTGEDRTGGGPRVSAPGWGWSETGERPTGGRWPANVILDEHAAELLDEQSGERKSGGPAKTRTKDGNIYGKYTPIPDDPAKYNGGDTGGASRFFYVAKASRAERNAGLDGMPPRAVSMNGAGIGEGRTPDAPVVESNSHPTVKPLALMRWLLTLVTPPGGIVLDPFVGSGSTLVACAQLGIPAYGIDMNEEYIEIAARRIDHALDERAREEAGPRQLSIAD